MASCVSALFLYTANNADGRVLLLQAGSMQLPRQLEYLPHKVHLLNKARDGLGSEFMSWLSSPLEKGWCGGDVCMGTFFERKVSLVDAIKIAVEVHFVSFPDSCIFPGNVRAHLRALLCNDTAKSLEDTCS